MRPQIKLPLARKLRREMTPPEVMIWSRLKGTPNSELRFRRQHPVGPYVLDFYCAKARLAIEIDGQVHGLDHVVHKDERRDTWLLSQGIGVIRINAVDVMADADAVAGIIWDSASARLQR
ncbi:endonuclease domain-containing protein [Asticcacaulis sp. ZE23SCel15]|uniref:endonuclease domain-containing protein n=1 Tax=Asticcacaulis sp. ZE23SCel15 TaxID=3059027 RepID=UPI00265FBD0C|nr:endonuclease domain-containing protein [Asticcacaulis sp. ZE23SCel15]WKL57900.1 endonuclease domain-containing protein [Asticcacaulis sp. ZE23SCel15]